MPRRGFFRDKKTSKKNKLQQKQQQQILRQQQQQQQHQPKQLSTSQGSSNNSNANDALEPPLGLSDPRQTALIHPKSRSYDPRVTGFHFQPKSKSPPQQISSSPGLRPNASKDVDQVHQNEQQFLYHQYQTQSSIPINQPPHPSQQQQQHYEENLHSQQYLPQQQQQHGTPPFASQPYHGHNESPPQQSHQQYPAHMLHPGSIPPQQHNIMAQNITPTVENAIDEIWRCETDDFRSASHAIQMLRLAIVAEWESQQLVDGEQKNHNYGGYDPSDTFLSLQGATLRFHARFESMKAERDENRVATQKKVSQIGDESVADHSTTANTVSTLNSALNGVEWELTEQAAWEVWEESVRASAALTHACVGPAWKRQLKLRRQLIRESEMRLLHQPHLQHQGRFADNMSVGSMTSLQSSLVSMDMSNAHSSGGRYIPSGSVAPPVWQPPTDILELLSSSIPEVLPAAMIRFAASVIETSIPPLRSANTKIYWEGGGEALLTALGQHLHDERRWLRRRKRLGDTQRDLAFGLFCLGDENDDNTETGGHRAAETEGNKSEGKWSIPGAHTPVAVMIHSWLETTLQAWPIPREIEEGSIPFHIDDATTNNVPINMKSSGASEEGNIASNESGPVTEIVLPVKMDPRSTPTNTSPMTSEIEPKHSKRFSLWGEIVDLSNIDWWYTLRVLRDFSDLVSAGWRPPPSGRIGDGIISSLIGIAEKGISHLADDDDKKKQMPEEQIRKERLVACSCASEALMAIKNLASRDVIPAVRPLAISLCQLISAAETPISSVPSYGEDALFEKEIRDVRTFVASNSAELLWVLLSNEGTSCLTTDALLDAIDMDLQLEVTDENRKLVEERVVIASGAIRALSAAMWGDPPSVRGVPLLRFFWEPVVDLFGAVASTFFQHNSDAPNAKFDIAGHETSVIVVDNQVVGKDNPFLNVIFEIILALQRLVDSEMVYGTGDLCATEWESFVRAIDIGISPWLVPRKNGSPLVQEIRSEAVAIFSQITNFLAKCSQNEYGFHLIVDDDARNYLHLFLLRKITPLIQMVDSFSKAIDHPEMMGDDSTTLALAVFKSWCVIRYLPFKDGDWAKRANDLLEEAFVVPKSQPGRYVGGYLHHPVVRLEALKSLVNDDSTQIDYSTMRDSDSVSTSGISTITSVSMKSGNPPVFSLFSLTKNLRELHLVLVNSIILPKLEETLSITMPILEKTECQPNQSMKKVSNADCFDIIENEFLLRRFAVKMLGMLFRSRTGEGEKRHHFIDLLQKVATSTPHGIREWVHQQEREDADTKYRAVEKSLSASVFLRGEEMNLRFEAIRQLEICLGAPFSSLPHTHGNVPDILKATSAVSIFYSIDYEEDAKYEMGLTDRLLMTLASVLPLARLSCARTGHAILMSRQHVTQSIPADLLSVVSVDEWLHNISPMVLNETLPMVSEENDFSSDHGDMAPFVFVKHYHSSGKDDNQSSQNSTVKPRRRQTRRSSIVMNGKQGTVVDFEPVAAVIKRVLNAVSCSLSQHDEGSNKLLFDRTISSTSLSQLPSILCTICYTVISSFLSHGMAFPGLDDLLWLDLDCTPDKSDNENEIVSRAMAVSVFGGVLGHIIVSRIGDEENNLQLGRRVCDVLVQLTITSKCQTSVQHACCGLISILSSLRHSFAEKVAKGGTSSPDPEISLCLVSFMDHVCSVLRKEESSSDLVLIPLIDAMREAATCADSVFAFPRSLCRRVFLTLFQPTREQWELQVVAFQCAVALINSMTANDANLMMFFAIGPKKNMALPNQKRIQPLLIDLLRYRLMSARLLDMSSSSKENYYKPSRVHNRLAHEALSLETFPVDLDDLGSPKISAWKCGNTILTLRLGSKDSLYRGWVEVVIRSPCSRIRRLIKWKKEFITEHPGSFLPFWEQLHPRRKKEAKTDVISVPESAPVQNTFVRSESDILANAKMIIARFDSLVDGSSLQQHNGKEDMTAKPERTVSESFHRKKPHRRKSKSFFGEKKDGEKASVVCSSLKRTLSDGDLMAMAPFTQPEILYERKRSVHSWLQYATGRKSIDIDLIQELTVLGFSRSILGVPETVITPASYQDLFVHERMTPYAVGPNFHRAMSILDRVTPFQTHRIALFYGGPFSTKRNTRNAKADSKTTNDGDKFLMATQGSTDFWQFSKELGDLVPVRHCKYFSGGLDTSESLSDGSFAIVWFGCQGGSYELNDPILVDSMVVFHTVTLMPDRVNTRKRHVGNDVVHIVYGLDIDTLDVDHERMSISGHFGFITIYVIPLVHAPLFKVSVHLKAGLDESICSAVDHLVGSWLVSRRVGAHFVRNLAVQADVICQSMIEDKLGLVLNTEDRNGRIRDTDRHLG
ncbi:hypothetical protein ACHAXR_012599 [Thalassiosira sp. AJA248-18]